MKKNLLLALCAILITACSEQAGYVISGSVDKADLNGKTVYLYEAGVQDAEAINSAVVENGSFTMKGVQDIPALYTLRFDEDVVEYQSAGTGENAAYRATFVLENGKLKVNLSENPSVTGTPENDALTALQKELIQLRTPMKELIDGMKSKDQAIAEAAEKKYDELDEKTSALVKKYIQKYPNNLTAGKLLNDFRYSFDEDTRRDIISKAGDTFKSVAGIDKIISHLAVLEKVAIGKKFTDFEMLDPKGKAIKLSDYVGKGKVVLIDFWASWCPPCRRDMPHLVEVYKQYKGKKFEIVGVSLDRTNDAWVKGIEELNITWPQMSDLKYWQSEGAALYGVNSIPHTVLIDGDGTILAKNLRAEALDNKLAEIIK
ncbi:peroxiredoxin [Parabacteroides sp. PF5-5]|uniref:TlpA disulfide reductase family protein n=1 Tax=unclassified Parabacteroides TaxID=2649774 RepID=UPI0024754F2D|nr:MULTISPECIES: TlpA disulfide reductase family protein [unclassified Parabacteroides]MDH6304321.1 peroxiredoxin [Parabacteroides sp. PH5-39]MDH6315526.1 peroxiredoxin [Parabacteroides sp. PF5-13]MDH6318980.1 peroxiredoxin [Parabacteroides sp. PH5-13]MDH6322709.1 peroxiredoxin [Parabacteroides sp. PH5-8]MDH6326719.1 peroxiredoxin [Parabacteroides sp. PH5-41]